VLAEGVRPGNTDQPYVARRLVRRAIRYGRGIGIGGPFMANLAAVAVETLAGAYPEIGRAQSAICGALAEEEDRFARTLARGERVFVRAVEEQRAIGATTIPGVVAFHLYDTYGFPVELTQELAAQQGLGVDIIGFGEAFAAHQEQSRQGSAGRFAGGLAERNPATTRLHTATHLLQAALREILGEHVFQRGSNITAERLRFDFSHSERVRPDQLAAVEAWVNTQIARDLPVTWQELPLEQARELGALGVFDDRYGEQVRVYRIGDASLEVCGGPHVEHTGDLGRFRILKEEAVAAGVRRVKGVLKDELGARD
jgi:alanyl-tRNA synthetase